jgi:thioredoxin-dependent peroxiredoxin
MSTTRKAPEFQLPDQDGKIRTLKEFLEKGPTVFVFYPGDFTPVCTKQLCSYRDASAEYESIGIQIVGISEDSPAKHRQFREKYGFQFPLLSDEGKKVAQAFGATSKWLLGAVTRANFVVTKAGDIVFEHVDAVPVTHQKSTDLQVVVKELKAKNLI